MRFVGGDPEEPSLKLALPLKGEDVLDDAQKRLLADFFHILGGETGTELVDKSSSGGVMPFEQLVPGIFVAFAAASQQFSLAQLAHPHKT
jgi:hypothetical protein